jgi:hypothetical protein
MCRVFGRESIGQFSDLLMTKITGSLRDMPF